MKTKKKGKGKVRKKKREKGKKKERRKEEKGRNLWEKLVSPFIQLFCYVFKLFMMCLKVLNWLERGWISCDMKNKILGKNSKYRGSFEVATLEGYNFHLVNPM